ncbi:hypothetical protein DE146DRAFT_680235 [Phaeosphaeria sp. MPI-PUGE-AT-0046c]|nr:hypothetical protein DE146DRAFT_680235 [Phaeosphaeria sp. MPI-PUGE-AT-0046c]
MPVTFQVADHPSKSWFLGQLVESREELFSRTCRDESRESSRIIQSSISPTTFSTTQVASSDNGFVKAVWNAYSYHHHLTIRPDDIWFAILSQLNFYINAHAEDLRSHFVDHEGKKELVVKEVGNIDTVDFGLLARRMTSLLDQNIKDPNFRDWIMPTFSTTTVDDRTTAAVLMMGSLQAYFSYTMTCCCGIPSVTLLGNREDYEDILQRLDKLSELGPETADWAALLRPIVSRFIASFDEVMSNEVKEFWTQAAHYQGGSGISLLTGWISAFCYWRSDGVSLHYQKTPDFHSPHVPNSTGNVRGGRYVLEGVTYHTIDTNDIPAGYASVPVKIDDNGEIHSTKMVAGSLGLQVGRSGEVDEKGEEKMDCVRSLSGWFMYELKEEGQAQNSRTAVKRA